MAKQFLVEPVEIDAAVGVLGDGHEVGDGFAPRQLVGMMFIGADEDDRPLVRRDVVGQAVALVEIGRDAQVEDADELVHRGGGAGPAEDDGMLIAGGADGLADDVSGILAETRGLPTGAARLGVRVGIQRHDLFTDVVLDERQAATGRGVVGIGEAAHAERSREGLVIADDAVADEADERLWVGVGQGRQSALRHGTHRNGCSANVRGASRRHCSQRREPGS